MHNPASSAQDAPTSQVTTLPPRARLEGTATLSTARKRQSPSRTDDPAARIDARNLTRTLSAYRDPRTGRSLLELAVTLIPFLAVWGLALAAIAEGYWIGLILTVPAAGLLVRLFIIQHDCGHRSFLKDRQANDWLGRALSVLTMTPYDDWRRDHALHHATSSNLDHRGIGDIDTLTVAEFRARSRWGRLRYRLYRHPLVMFGIGPAYQFLLRHRVPSRPLSADRRAWLGVMLTNVAIAALSAALIAAFGLVPFLAVHLPVVIMAAAMGVWLFYVQHQFEETVWDREDDWDLHETALHGSSHYDLPPVLRWFSGNIGVHHVHHLSSRIPFYRLPETLRDHPELADLGRLSLTESLGTVRLTLWDEEERRLIGFRDLAAE